MAIVNGLSVLAAEMAEECYAGRYNSAKVLDEINVAELPASRGSRDWRGWVPDGFRRIWSTLPTDVRLAIFAMACCAMRD